jgi:hypothetical protein
LVKNISKVIIVAACAVLALAACSAHGLNTPRSLFQASTACWLNYDPQTEVQDPISVRNADIKGYLGWERDGYKLVAVGASLEPAPLPDGLSVSAEDGALSISLSKPAPGSVYLYAFYPDDVHPSELAAGAAINDGQIFLAVPAGDNSSRPLPAMCHRARSRESALKMAREQFPRLPPPRRQMTRIKLPT